MYFELLSGSLRRADVPVKNARSLNHRYALHKISGQISLAESDALALGSGGIPTYGVNFC